jgi:hypothetical protein
MRAPPGLSSSPMLKTFAQGLLFLIFLGLLLFIPAGTWRWPQGWILLGLFSAARRRRLSPAAGRVVTRSS